LIEAQTLSGQVKFKLSDVLGNRCLDFDPSLMSVVVDYPTECISRTHKKWNSLLVDIFATEKADPSSAVQLRLFYDGLELIQNSTQPITAKKDTEGHILTQACIPVEVVFSFAYGSELFAIVENKVHVYDFFGTLLNSWGDIGAEPGSFKDPRSIAVCNGLVYVADTGNHRIQTFTLAGEFIREFSFTEPTHLSVYKDMIWASNSSTIIAMDNNGVRVHEVSAIHSEIDCFSVWTDYSKIIVKTKKSDSFEINLAGKKTSGLKIARHYWAIGDFLVKVDINRQLKVYNKHFKCILVSKMYREGRNWSFSLLPFGKLIITCIQENKTLLAVLDSGLDTTCGTLPIIKYVQEESKRRNVDLNGIMRTLIPMCTETYLVGKQVTLLSVHPESDEMKDTTPLHFRWNGEEHEMSLLTLARHIKVRSSWNQNFTADSSTDEIVGLAMDRETKKALLRKKLPEKLQQSQIWISMTYRGVELQNSPFSLKLIN
jgi:hypothetical protein